MVGSMTPMHGVGSGRTPMYGSQTPQHGDGQLIVSMYSGMYGSRISSVIYGFSASRTPLYHSDYTAPSPLGNISPLTPSNSYDSLGNINPLTPGANYDGMCCHYCVTVCVCVRACVHACLCMRMCLHMRVCMCVGGCVHVRVCVCMCI